MRLTNLLSKNAIIPDLSATDKEGVLHELVERLYDSKLITNMERVEKALMDRERLGSTGIGSYVAIPHAKCDDTKELVAAFGKSREGVEFDALDQKKVHYVFLLLAPKSEVGKHLKALARISRLVRTDGFCKKLKDVSTQEEILETFNLAEQSF